MDLKCLALSIRRAALTFAAAFIWPVFVIGGLVFIGHIPHSLLSALLISSSIIGGLTGLGEYHELVTNKRNKQ